MLVCICTTHARVIVAGDFLVEADTVVSSKTSWAIIAGGGDPFDTNSLADLDVGGLGSWAHLDDSTNTLVSSYLAWLGWEWKASPGICHYSEVRMTHTTAMSDGYRGYREQ